MAFFGTKIMNRFLDYFTPRFITENVAVKKTDDGYTVICTEESLQWDSDYDFIASCRSFNFFGHSYWAKITLPDSEL